MNKTTVSIKGMHCKSCEILIEDELKKIHNVENVDISHKTGVAEIYFKGHVLAHSAIVKAVKEAGYEIGITKKLPFFSTKFQDYSEFIVAFIIVVLLYLIAKEIGLFQLVSSVKGEYSNLLVVLLVGLTAGVSTCMALVGGLVLGITSSYSQSHISTSSTARFSPHIFFNLGRVIGFFILGGVIGQIGSVFQISTSLIGGLTVVIGLVMIFLGLQLISIFPRLSSISLTLPKGISRFFGISEKAENTYSHIQTMILGGLTFFLPCGFTQAMQLFAIGSGSFLRGALVMSVFAIGTAPGLLGIGGLTALLKGSFSRYFFKFAGIVVIAMAVFNMSNGINLLRTTGLIPILSKSTVATQDPNVTIENGIQIVRMIQNGNGYSPNSFTIKKDTPVRWIIKSEESRSCASSLVVPKLNIRAQLTEKEQIFEFTPKEVGEIPFSCSMGMYSGVFNIVDNDKSSSSTKIINNDSTQIPQTNTVSKLPSTCTSCGSGGGCGCGQKTQKQADLDADKTSPVVAQQEGVVQVLKATYSVSEDIKPTKFTVKAGNPVRFDIEAKEDGQGCMGSIMIPGLDNQAQGFEKGKTTTLTFTPIKPGSYTITCAMGVPRGTIIVEL